MSVMCKEKSTDTYYIFLKGATESVLSKCTKIQLGENETNLDCEKFKPELYDQLEKLASKGLVVIKKIYTFFFNLRVKNFLLYSACYH
jgi:magnesium-transporting ATPase (P-type)